MQAGRLSRSKRRSPIECSRARFQDGERAADSEFAEAAQHYAAENVTAAVHFVESVVATVTEIRHCRTSGLSIRACRRGLAFTEFAATRECAEGSRCRSPCACLWAPHAWP